MARNIAAVLLGLVLAFVIVFLVEGIASHFYPPPPNLNLADKAAMKAFIEKMPTSAFLLIEFGWFAGALVGSFVAARIAQAKPDYHGLIVGGLAFAAAIANMMLFPHPVWFWILTLLSYALATGAGIWLARISRPAAQAPNATPVEL
jgi:hypothetical protein